MTFTTHWTPEAAHAYLDTLRPELAAQVWEDAELVADVLMCSTDERIESIHEAMIWPLLYLNNREGHCTASDLTHHEVRANQLRDELVKLVPVSDFAATLGTIEALMMRETTRDDGPWPDWSQPGA